MAMQRPRRRSLAQARAETEAVLSGVPREAFDARPKRKNRHIESQHGRALISWRDRAKKTTRPEVEWLHHVPNGVVMGSEKLAGMLKAEGLTKGVLDYLLPVSHLFDGDLHAGLYLELKAPGLENHKNGGLSDDQVKFAKFVHAQGYVVVLCYHWHQAKDAIEAYLDGKPIPHLWSPTP